MKIKKWLKNAKDAILMMAGLLLVGVPPKIIVGVVLILLSITYVALDCMKIYEESLKDEE